MPRGQIGPRGFGQRAASALHKATGGRQQKTQLARLLMLSPELSELNDLSLICKGRHEIWLQRLGMAQALPMDPNGTEPESLGSDKASLLRAKPPKGGDAEPRD